MGIFNAATTYGQGFKPTTNANEYSIKIYVGGFAGQDTAEKKAMEEADKFMNKNGYTKYKIQIKKFNLFPLYYLFIVQFEK